MRGRVGRREAEFSRRDAGRQAGRVSEYARGESGVEAVEGAGSVSVCKGSEGLLT